MDTFAPKLDPVSRLVNASRATTRLLGRRGGLAQIGWWRAAEARRPVGPDGGPTPWMSSVAVEILDQLAPAGARVLELGTGSSTGWWARRGAEIVAFEDDPGWYDTVSTLVPAAVDLRLVGDGAALERALDDLRQGPPFDVIVSDGIEPRVHGLEHALALTHERTLVVVDNSDRSPMTEFLDDLVSGGWWCLRVFGLVPTHGVAHETAFLSRHGMEPRGRTRPRALPAR